MTQTAEHPAYREPIRQWPSDPPPGYRGQLDPGFQAWLAATRADLQPEDCDFYHTTTLPDGALRRGQWDLRDHESVYVGEVDFAGRTVLELGPASGHLTWFMEDRGAAVTAFEAGYDARFELVPPVDGTDFATWQSDFMAHIGRINNAWWYQHRARHSTARMVYGDIYNLPDDLGRFDVAFFGCILLHLRDPYRALAQAAEHVVDTMVVTDMRHAGLEDSEDPLLRWGMDAGNLGPSAGWWQLSPGAVTRMLWRLGFERSAVHFHNQTYEHLEKPELGPVDVGHFTVVARRPGPTGS